MIRRLILASALLAPMPAFAQPAASPPAPPVILTLQQAQTIYQLALEGAYPNLQLKQVVAAMQPLEAAMQRAAKPAAAPSAHAPSGAKPR